MKRILPFAILAGVIAALVKLQSISKEQRLMSQNFSQQMGDIDDRLDKVATGLQGWKDAKDAEDAELAALKAQGADTAALEAAMARGRASLSAIEQVLNPPSGGSTGTQPPPPGDTGAQTGGSQG